MRKANLYAVMTAAAVSMAILSGCSGSQTAATTAAETTTVAETTAEETTAEATEAEEEDEENYDTGDASMDNTRNQDEIGENELLVVSFGTSYNDSRRLTVGAIENAIENAFPDYSVRTSDDDFKAVISAITDATKEYDDGETAICFMGHGTEADSNAVYQKMQDMLKEEGFDNYYVGTVEATPSCEDVIAQVKEGSYKKVVLEPLMIVAGDHANNDMAGDDDDSWKSQFKAAGYEVTCLVRGLGELEPIQQLFVQHAQAAVDSLAK